MIDPPGPLANTYEPIDFTTTALVTSISIEYNPTLGTGGRETVWDGTADADNSGGDFSYLYRASSKSGTGPYTWHIVRQGRWPADFRIRIKEASTAGTSTWKQIYAVDFTALATQVMTTAGSYTVDGKTWYAKGLTSFNGDTMSSGVVNGSGLHIGCSGSAATPFGSTAQYDGRFLAMSMSQLSNFDPDLPWLARAHFTHTNDTCVAMIGLVDSTLDGASLLASQRAADVFIGNDTNNPTSNTQRKLGLAGLSGAAGFHTSAAPSATVYGVLNLNATQIVCGTQNWSGSMPAASGFRVVQTTAAMTNVSYSHKMLAFAINQQTGSSWDAYMTHLTIHQPG